MSHYRAHVILDDGDTVSNLLDEYGPDAVEEVPDYDLDDNDDVERLLEYVHGLVESNIDDTKIRDLYNSENYVGIIDRYSNENYYLKKSENVIYRLDSLQIWDGYEDQYGGRYGEELICFRDSKQYKKNRKNIDNEIHDDVTLNIMSYFSSSGVADELYIPGVSDESLIAPFKKDLEAYIVKAITIKGDDTQFSEAYNGMKFNRNVLGKSFVEYGLDAFMNHRKELHLTTHKEITKYVADCLLETLYCSGVEYMISADGGMTSDQEDMLEWYNIAIANKSTIVIVDLHN